VSLFHQALVFIADCTCYLTYFYFITASIQEAIDSAILFMREHEHLTTMLHLKPLEMSVKILTGAGTGQSRNQLEIDVLANKNPHQLIIA
jgi:hypothetical protein